MYETARCFCEIETSRSEWGGEGNTSADFLFLIFHEQVAKFLKEEVRPALIPYQSQMGGKIELAL